jgi:phosphodiester glycosidase/flagellar hook capping protein FlgD
VVRLAVIAGALAALVAVSGATAQPQELVPGLTFEREVQFTTHGPVVVNVLTGPRPGGLWTLTPAISNDAFPGTEQLTALEQRLAPTASVAGINGDLFNTQTGAPSGLLMRGGAIEHFPLRDRSSGGLDGAGNLLVSRLQLIATWQGSGQRRPFTVINDQLTVNGIALYTPAWGPTAPVGAVSAVLEPFPGVQPGGTPSGPVTQVVQNAAAPIPADGVVLVAKGTGAATALAAEAPVGRTVTLRPVLKPDWSGVVSGFGGGPILVRNGHAVFRANEAFTTDQLMLRAPRAAIGQLADGRILLVAVDGGRPGLSTGMSNFDLAQTMVHLGATTAIALGAGAQVSLAFNGSLLNAPSGPEAPLAEALLFEYAGVYAPQPLEPVLSPNNDGVAEKQELSYTIVRPSTVNAALIGPDGVPRYQFSGQQPPGTYPLEFTGLKADGTPDTEGLYRWTISATDDLGRASSIERPFFLNDTLGFAKAVPPTLGAPRQQPRTVATMTLAHAATVTTRIETTAGVLVRNLGSRQLEPGPLDIAWDGVSDSGAVVYSGRFVARASATNEFGTVDLAVPFAVRRVAGHG